MMKLWNSFKRMKFCQFLSAVVGFQQREVLRNLVNKNLKAKYAGSMLGMLWAFINPVLLAFIVGFIFTNILKVNTPNYYLYILSGMLPWTFFATSIQEASVSIQGHASLLKQFPLARIFIPVAIVISNFILLLFSLTILLPLFLIVDLKVITLLPLLVFALIILLLFTLGLSLMFAAICVEWRDVQQALNTLLVYWLWLTPIFYSAQMVPRDYKILLDINPINFFLILYRNSLFDVKTPSLGVLGIPVIMALGALWCGIVLFHKKEGGFLKRI